MADELVLIVEDNDKNLELVQDILELRGFRTLAATCGREGIVLARTHRPHVVLMDIQLPDLNGLDVLRELRADRSTADIPVVALTAFAMSGDRTRLLEAGFDDYLAKPIDVRTLPALVARHCH
ncbi:MAG: response regulator [Chloroflexi bacterium]|nr:response regulator [Chloroflexota bacterium]MBV9547942.1 response regulator [Chloroflexota bacterium]